MSEKTILITRPKGDEQALTELLHASGYRVIHEPLMEIFLLHMQRQTIEQALLSEPDAVLITSRHGVQALALLTELRDPFLLCVGEATAETALSLGFTHVTPTGGNVASMVDYVADGYDPGSRFLYVSGKHVQLDLDAALAQKGMEVQRAIAYDALAAEHLSDTLIEQLKRGQVDAVTFLSQRTAQIFTDLLAKAGISQSALQMEAFALSETIADTLPAAWKAIHVADDATLASLVECVDNCFAKRG